MGAQGIDRGLCAELIKVEEGEWPIDVLPAAARGPRVPLAAHGCAAADVSLAGALPTLAPHKGLEGGGGGSCADTDLNCSKLDRDEELRLWPCEALRRNSRSASRPQTPMSPSTLTPPLPKINFLNRCRSSSSQGYRYRLPLLLFGFGELASFYALYGSEDTQRCTRHRFELKLKLS
uniref:Uncharacterized protein n=1 Tax=Haemonchus placei TaxID=6290 RepID=A0A0N4WJE3_HAEPC